MLFSSFRHTLHYLYKHFGADGFRAGMIHGGTPDEERVALRNRFEKSREDMDCLDILLFSEIGCEGLDYQFCDCIVNYDLPWNPMRVEQRIGRIDRNGQKSESVAIINLITPVTVGADIYDFVD
jgi:superfamily II DNA/RNA helicase